MGYCQSRLLPMGPPAPPRLEALGVWGSFSSQRLVIAMPNCGTTLAVVCLFVLATLFSQSV